MPALPPPFQLQICLMLPVRDCFRRCVHEQITVLTDLVEFIKMVQRQPNTSSPLPPLALPSPAACGEQVVEEVPGTDIGGQGPDEGDNGSGMCARVCGDLSSLGAHEAIPTRIFMESRCPCFAELYMHACTNHTVDFITFSSYASSLSASLLLIFSHVMGV